MFKIAPCKGILGNFCSWNLVKSGIQDTAQGIHNPSSTERESSAWNLESTMLNSEFKAVLDSLTWGD